MKAQMQIVSIILILGIIVVLIGATYFWGKPLIDKRTMITKLASLKEFMKRLDENIVDMARSCTGYCDETMTMFPGSFIEVHAHDDPDPDNNSIILEFAVDYMMMGNESIPLNTNVIGDVAPYGETNGVLTMRQILRGQQYMIIFKLHYRELDTSTIPKEGYKIIIEPEAMSGQNSVTMSFGGTALIPGAANGGQLTTTKIKISTV